MSQGENQTGRQDVSILLGGCNFISSYPMSPSTGFLTFLARHAAEFDMIVEQSEDEIATVNTALGASYAGARAMVTTSRGVFYRNLERSVFEDNLAPCRENRQPLYERRIDTEKLLELIEQFEFAG